jgi:hypothetical protein
MSHLDVSYFEMDFNDEIEVEKYNELFEKNIGINTISIRFSSENATDTILVLRTFLMIQKHGGYKSVTYDYNDIDFKKCKSHYTCNIILQEDEFPCMLNLISKIKEVIGATKSGQVFITYTCDPTKIYNQLPFGVIIITKTGVYNVSGTACVQFLTNNFIE